MPIAILFIFAFWQGLSSLWAINISESLFAAGNFFLLPITVLTTLAVFKKNDKAASLLLIPIITAGTVLCLHGWYSYFAIGEIEKIKALYVIQGFSGFKNLFSIMLFFNVIFCIVAFVTWISKLKWIAIVSAILSALLIVILLGRASFIGLLVSILSFACLYLAFTFAAQKQETRRKILSISVVLLSIVILAATLLNQQITERYNVANFSSSFTAKERIQLWSKTNQLIKQQPIIGHGAGNWHIVFPSTDITDMTRMSIQLKGAQRPHNDYLWILSETGIIGFVLYMTFMFLLVFLAVRALIVLKKENKDVVPLSILISGFIGYLIIAFFDFPKERIDISLMLAFLIAYIIYYSNVIEFEISLKPMISKILSVSLLSVLMFNVYIGYTRYNGEQTSKKLVADFRAEKHNVLESLSKKAMSNLYNIDPLLNPIPFYAGYGALKKDQSNKALQYFEEALKISPYHFKTLSFIGIQYGKMGDFKKAIPYYEKAFEINNIHLQTNEGLAICYFNTGEKEKAKQVITGLDSDNNSIIKMKEILNVE